MDVSYFIRPFAVEQSLGYFYFVDIKKLIKKHWKTEFCEKM